MFSLLRNIFLKRSDPHLLTVGMTGVKMGDRLLQIGCADGGSLGAVAAKVGLSGRAVLAAPDEASAKRGREGAEAAGVLVEVEAARPASLPFSAGDFDVAVIDDTSGLLSTMGSEDRAAAIAEIARVLREGGRVVLIGSAPRSGISAFRSHASNGPPSAGAAEVRATLEAKGFRAVRILAEREGLVFVEGVKPALTSRK